MSNWASNNAIQIAQNLDALNATLDYRTDFYRADDPFDFYNHLACGTLDEIMTEGDMDAEGEGDDFVSDIFCELEGILAHCEYWDTASRARWTPECRDLVAGIVRELDECGFVDRQWRVWLSEIIAEIERDAA